MKRWFRNLSIGGKLRFMFVMLSGTLITIVTFSYTALEVRSIRDGLADQYGLVASVVAANSRAAVAQDDQAAAQRLVDRIVDGSEVDAAAIVDNFGQTLASAAKEGRAVPEIERWLVERSIVAYEREAMVASAPIELDGGTIGHVMIATNYSALDTAQQQLLAMVFGALFIAFAFAYIASSPLQRLVARPISKLANEMSAVTAEKDYSRRVEVASNDEVGELYHRFNLMLDEIESRDRHIEGERARLEVEVAQRTVDLTRTNDKLAENVTELNVANQAALAAAESKAVFLANMSHEIRTPMNGVLGMLELVRSTKLASEQRDYIETAYHSGQSLLALINDILDLSKIEAGKMDIEARPTAAAEVVEDVCSILQTQAAAQGIELVALMDKRSYETHLLDPTRLRQVLLNLIGNAIKFTEAGAVWIEGTVGDERGTAVLQIAVHDTGIGISAEAQKKLFDVFTQADGSTTRKYGGSGLGLAITRQLVELMGGAIECRSEPGKGSTFSFTLPVGACSDETAQPPQPESVPKVTVVVRSELMERAVNALLAVLGGTTDRHADIVVTDDPELAAEGRRIVLITSPAESAAHPAHDCLLTPLRLRQFAEVVAGSAPTSEASRTKELTTYPSARVLLAEDNPVNQLVATKMLAKHGITCDVAVTGLEVLEHVRSNAYDLVFMDCQMPEMDGYEATAELRRLEHETGAAAIPVVALTANAMEGDAEKCLAAGMDDYLAKPLEQKRLSEVLANWLDAQHMEGPPASARR